jgi:hypothetical protein
VDGSAVVAVAIPNLTIADMADESKTFGNLFIQSAVHSLTHACAPVRVRVCVWRATMETATDYSECRRCPSISELTHRRSGAPGDARKSRLAPLVGANVGARMSAQRRRFSGGCWAIGPLRRSSLGRLQGTTKRVWHHVVDLNASKSGSSGWLRCRVQARRGAALRAMPQRARLRYRR